MNHTQILQSIYNEMEELDESDFFKIKNKLKTNEIEWLDLIIDKREYRKAVLTVFITSLTHKMHSPEQDIRYHQKDLEGGYSGRVIDTKYITPFMKKVRFPHMAESGWLTRSLEQKQPYNLEFGGSITPSRLKNAFLNLLNKIEEENKNPEIYLKYLFYYLIKKRRKKESVEFNNFESANILIKEIIEIMKKHLYADYRYNEGNSRLPTIMIYSVYQSMVKELKRFEGKKLLELESHTASDRSTGAIGDIEIERIKEKTIYEGVEIKHGRKIDMNILNICYNKFKDKPVNRYYILSTEGIEVSDKKKIEEKIKKIKSNHGCQVITNGIFDSLKYYLRLISNTKDFILNYTDNLKKDGSLRLEHVEKWQELVETYSKK